MPLSEISANVRRSGSTTGVKRASEMGSDLYPPRPPSTVHGMLKTTTELGDVGQFASRSSRLPPSGSRFQSTRPRSGSFDTSFASALRHNRSSHVRRPGRRHGPRPAVSMSGMSSIYHASQPSGSSYGPRSRRQTTRRWAHPYYTQGLADPGPESRRLYTHSSLVTLRNDQDMYSVRSTSPMMHLGPGRRRRRRPPSPAHSDVRSFASTPRPNFGHIYTTGTALSSSASGLQYRAALLDYRADVNASRGSLIRQPSPAISPTRNMFISNPGPRSRTSTPMSPSFNAARSFLPDIAAILPRSHTSATFSAYYDYSESFLEEDCFSPGGGVTVSVPPLNMDQMILEGVPTLPSRDAQTPFGTRPGSAFHPSELATHHNRRLSDHSNHLQCSPRSTLSHHSFNGVIPKRVSSLAAPILNEADLVQVRGQDTDGDDGGPDDDGKAPRQPSRASITSKRSNTPLSTSVFFPNAARSSRGLTTLAARVHTPSAEVGPMPAGPHTVTLVEKNPNLDLSCVSNLQGRSNPNWQIPPFRFKPISFAQNTPSPSTRPKTCEGTPNRNTVEIWSPVPERPMSSRSRTRFSKILGMKEHYNCGTLRSCSKHLAGEEGHAASDARETTKQQPLATVAQQSGPTSSATEELSSSPAFNHAGLTDVDPRLSQVTSHDKSTVESLLDRHIESLGLRPDIDSGSETSTSLQDVGRDEQSRTGVTVCLTDMLATAPSWVKGRPWTSSSQRPSSLEESERRRLRPRRLFASMDADLLRRRGNRWPPAYSSDSIGNTSRPSYGWQTLPSSNFLAECLTNSISTVVSGNLGDVESSEPHTKVNDRQRGNSVHEASMFSRPPGQSPTSDISCKPARQPRRSRSEIVSSQLSHKRRRMRIMLKLDTKSRTMGDMNGQHVRPRYHSTSVADELTGQVVPRSGIKSPVIGYAELSADSAEPSTGTVGCTVSKIPQIPTRWSSIIAAMPQPVKKSVETVRAVSKRSNQSHKSNASIVQPVNTTRISHRVAQTGSMPKSVPSDCEAPLTFSDLDLSIPYANAPSTIRPTLRETKSFFSDESSAKPQRRSLREKLTLRSLRHALPSSSVTPVVIRETSKADTPMSYSCQMKGRNASDGSAFIPDDDFIPMSDFAYRKRKVVEKIKDWWQRQCMPRKLASRRRRGRAERTAPGGTGW